MTAAPIALRNVLPLDLLTRADATHVGAKAANLGELRRAGFPVPDGFVLAGEPDAEFHAALAALGDVPLAVRSSGMAEDGAQASFAGQFETVLEVRGLDAVLAAVQRCRDSAGSMRVGAYRSARAAASDTGLAVLVQRMVPADAAGVAFTANPVSGVREEVLVSAVRGLGDRLVSGEADPDEWVVTATGIDRRRALEGALDDIQVRAVADLARQVEATFGVPQDVEWAIADGQLYLLQARPITALPEPVRMEPVPVAMRPGFWEREGTHYPQPISPMFRLLLEVFNASLCRIFGEMGMLSDGLELAEFGGWVYQRMVPLGGKEPPALPGWLQTAITPLMLRIVPQLRARLQKGVDVVRRDVLWSWIERWEQDWKPSQRERVAAFRRVDLAQLDDAALAKHLAELRSLLAASFDIHVRVAVAASFLPAECMLAVQEWLGWEATRSTDLFCGLSSMSTEPARELARLAALARRNPALVALLEHPSEAVERISELDPEFAAEFAEYQSVYGCRALRYEIADPTLAESPDLVLGLVRDQLHRGFDAAAEASRLADRRAQNANEVRAQLAHRPAELARFDRLLARAQRAYPLREENEFTIISQPTALLRYAALEIGRRLESRGSIVARDDVFFLDWTEASAALLQLHDRRELVARRKAERAWTLAHPGPESYGRRPGAPPSLGVLPPEVRGMLRCFIWCTEQAMPHIANTRRYAVGATQLEGIGALANRYTGPVRVIRSEAEFHKIQAGDVLVCPITSPVWSVLFPSVGALVTDTGGILSHSAIIAREYGIPAVLATGNATDVLQDNQLVTVDGTAGTVEVLA